MARRSRPVDAGDSAIAVNPREDIEVRGTGETPVLRSNAMRTLDNCFTADRNW